MKKYRIHYSTHVKGGSNTDCTKTIEKKTDEEAIKEFERLKQEARDNRGLYYTSYLYHKIERIDQEEVTTPLPA